MTSYHMGRAIDSRRLRHVHFATGMHPDFDGEISRIYVTGHFIPCPKESFGRNRHVHNRLEAAVSQVEHVQNCKSF